MGEQLVKEDKSIEDLKEQNEDYMIQKETLLNNAINSTTHDDLAVTTSDHRDDKKVVEQQKRSDVKINNISKQSKEDEKSKNETNETKKDQKMVEETIEEQKNSKVVGPEKLNSRSEVDPEKEKSGIIVANEEVNNNIINNQNTDHDINIINQYHSNNILDSFVRDMDTFMEEVEQSRSARDEDKTNDDGLFLFDSSTSSPRNLAAILINQARTKIERKLAKEDDDQLVLGGTVVMTDMIDEAERVLLPSCMKKSSAEYGSSKTNKTVTFKDDGTEYYDEFQDLPEMNEIAEDDHDGVPSETSASDGYY